MMLQSDFVRPPDNLLGKSIDGFFVGEFQRALNVLSGIYHTKAESAVSFPFFEELLV
jgi:hypothetical protein